MDLLISVGVSGSSIQEGGDFIEGITWSKTAVVTETSMGADKVHASLVVAPVESIILGDLNGQAVAILGTITTLGCLLGLLVLNLSLIHI